MKADSDGTRHVFEVEVYLGDLHPDEVCVQLYADGIGGRGPVREEMRRGQELESEMGGYVYSATVAAGRPAPDYTPRIVPRRAGVEVPLEATQILWQR